MSRAGTTILNIGNNMETGTKVRVRGTKTTGVVTESKLVPWRSDFIRVYVVKFDNGGEGYFESKELKVE